MLKRVAMAFELALYYSLGALSWVAFAALFPALYPLSLITGQPLTYLPLRGLEPLSLRHRSRMASLSGKGPGALDSMKAWNALSFKEKRKASAKRRGDREADRSGLSKEQIKINDKLGVAARTMSLAECQKWIAKGADPLADLDGQGGTAFDAFCDAFGKPYAVDKTEDLERGLSVAKALLEAPAGQERLKETASALLAKKSHLPLPFLRLLMDKGADVNRANPDGETALIKACSAAWLYKKTIEALLAAGADAGVCVSPARLDGRPRGMQRRAVGFTALMAFARDSNSHGAKLNERAALVASLMGAGARVDAIDSDGLSALHHAAQCRNFEMIHVLLDQGANPMLRDAEGKLALERWDPRTHDESQRAISEALARLRSAREREEIAQSAAAGASSQGSSSKRL